MQSIREYNQTTTSPYELLVHLYDRILTGKTQTFEALKTYASSLPETAQTRAVFKRGFELIRKTSWGLFRNLSHEAYPELWRLLVVPDRDYAFAGDLKRTVSSPDLFVGMIDIHGYTKFCQRNRHNMTMLDFLDRVLFDDVAHIAAEAGVISKRANGDEILLVGASVADVVETVLMVMTYLSKDLKTKVAGAQKKASEHVFLPDFAISAGVTGGQKYASLVVTRDGDLSGDLVNTAARLQARANKISPEQNKILLSGHAYHRLKAKLDPGLVSLPYRVGFFNTGSVEFKGVSLPVFEVVFLDTESHRVSYQTQMVQLYRSLQKKLWRSKVLEDALALASALALNLPDLGSLDRDDLMARIRIAGILFDEDQFERAVSQLDAVITDLESLESWDPLAVEYLRQIRVGYRLVLDSFHTLLDRQLETQRDAQREILAKYHALYETTRKDARSKVRNHRGTWFQAAEDVADGLEVRIRSMK
jgi:class 3 adenylate cyclase